MGTSSLLQGAYGIVTYAGRLGQMERLPRLRVIFGYGYPKMFHEVAALSLMIACESQVEPSKLMLISILGPEKKMRLVCLLLFALFLLIPLSGSAEEYRDPFADIHEHMEWDRENETFQAFIQRLYYLAFADVPKKDLRKLLIHISAYAKEESVRIQTGHEYNPDDLIYMNSVGYALEIFDDYDGDIGCSGIRSHIASGYKIPETQWHRVPYPIQEIMPLLISYCKAPD